MGGAKMVLHPACCNNRYGPANGPGIYLCAAQGVIFIKGGLDIHGDIIDKLLLQQQPHRFRVRAVGVQFYPETELRAAAMLSSHVPECKAFFRMKEQEGMAICERAPDLQMT